MKALVVRQPYASWIATRAKTIELRSRRTHYRGPLLNHTPVPGNDLAVLIAVDREPEPDVPDEPAQQPDLLFRMVLRVADVGHEIGDELLFHGKVCFSYKGHRLTSA